jgi:hypothetical protein
MASTRPSADAEVSRRKAGLLVAVVLGAYAAVVGTLAFLRGGSEGGGGGVPADLSARLDQDARRVREETKGDLERAVTEWKETTARALQEMRADRDAWKAAYEQATRHADEAARSTSARAEQIQERLDDVERVATEAKTTADGAKAAIQTAPPRVATETPPAAPPSPPPTPPTEVAPAPPAPGPTAEQLAANKEKVRAAIAELSSTDSTKVFTAAGFLGKAGDPEAVGPLTALLRDSRDWQARSQAADSLGQLLACDAVPALLAAFLDKSPAVFLSASQSVARITGQVTGLSGEASKRDKTEARDRIAKWWHEHEAEVRSRLKQPAKPGG